MPTLGFLKKIRSKEQKNSPSSSQVTSPITPTSSRGFDNTKPSISSQSTNPQAEGTSQSPAPIKEESPAVAGEPRLMTQGVAHQQQTYAASPGNTGSAEQQNLPSINNLIHPPQHDGATQSHPAQEASNTPAAANAGASNPQHHTQHHTEHHTQQHTEQHTQHHAQQHTEQHAQHHAQHHTQQLPQAQAVQQQPQIRQTKGKYSLADFELQRTLGTGSFGRVHLVQSKHNQRFYAIKVLKKAQVVKMKQVEHTNDERRMLQEVKHPFLITLWGTFQDSKNLYMVMDFVEGGELFSLLRKSQVGGF